MRAHDPKGKLAAPGGNAGKRKSHAHWASKCKVDFTMEFEQRCIPLETDTVEEGRKEMNSLETFFQMSQAEMQSSVSALTISSAALAFVEAGQRARVTNDGERIAVDEDQKEKVPQMAKFASKWRMITELPSSPEPASSPNAKEESSKSARGASVSLAPLSAPGSAQGARPQRTVGITGSALVAESAPAGGTCTATGSSRVPALPAAAADVPLSARVERSSTMGPYALSLTDVEEMFGSRSWDQARPWRSKTEKEKEDEKSRLKQVHQRIHRPISPWELHDTNIPVPITVAPLFKRPQSPRRQESHYEYFTKKIPGERPEYRRALQSKTEATRRIYRMQVPGQARDEEFGSYGSSWLPESAESRSPRGTCFMVSH